MIRLILFLENKTQKENLILFFTLANIVYLLMLFYSIPEVMNYANGMKLFDVSPTGYSINYASNLLEKLGSTGRNFYCNVQLPLDLLYPGLCAMSYGIIIIALLKKIKKWKKTTSKLSLIPFIASFFDYGENIGIYTMIKTFPNLSSKAVHFSCICTILKSLLTTFYFVLIIGLLLYWVIFFRIKKIRKKNTFTL